MHHIGNCFTCSHAVFVDSCSNYFYVFSSSFLSSEKKLWSQTPCGTEVWGNHHTSGTDLFRILLSHSKFRPFAIPSWLSSYCQCWRSYLLTTSQYQLLPGGGGQGLVGVPVLGGKAGGTSSFLAGGSSNRFLVMIKLLTELDMDELKESSLLAFNKRNSNIHTFSAILLYFPLLFSNAIFI